MEGEFIIRPVRVVRVRLNETAAAARKIQLQYYGMKIPCSLIPSCLEGAEYHSAADVVVIALITNAHTRSDYFFASISLPTAARWQQSTKWSTKQSVEASKLRAPLLTLINFSIFAEAEK